MESLPCECGMNFKTKLTLSNHKRYSCPLTEHVTFECPNCNQSFTRKDILNTHLKRCTVTQPTTSIGNDSTQQQNNTTTANQTGHNHGNHNGNILTKTKTINNFNFHANISDEYITNLLLSKFDLHYIKKGEAGIYDFIFYEIFTDPSDSKNLAIMCTNYKTKRFRYAILTQDGKHEIKEDINLKNFNEYLNNFNKVIKYIMTQYSPYDIGCLGITSEVTKRNIDTLFSSLCQRKQLSPYIIDKINSSQNDITQEEPTSEDKCFRYMKELEEQGIGAHLKYKPSMESNIRMAEYYEREARRDPNYENFLQLRKTDTHGMYEYNHETKEIEVSSRHLKESEEEQKLFEYKVKEKARVRKEKEEEAQRKRLEALDNKEKIRRANEIAKHEAFLKKIEKKKNKLDQQIAKKTNSTPLTTMETIEE